MAMTIPTCRNTTIQNVVFLFVSLGICSVQTILYVDFAKYKPLNDMS